MEGKKIRAHKIVLGLRSHYFKGLFKEKGIYVLLAPSLDLGLTELTIESNYEVFAELIHFCYKPTISFTDSAKLRQLKEMNLQYEVLELSEIIEEKLKEITSNVNSSLGFKLETSVVIQTEMATGSVYVLLKPQH